MANGSGAGSALLALIGPIMIIMGCNNLHKRKVYEITSVTGTIVDIVPAPGPKGLNGSYALVEYEYNGETMRRSMDVTSQVGILKKDKIGEQVEVEIDADRPEKAPPSHSYCVMQIVLGAVFTLIVMYLLIWGFS